MPGIFIAALACAYAGVGIAFSIPMLKPHIGVGKSSGGAPWTDGTGDNIMRGASVLILAIIWPIAGTLWTLGKLAR